jgi:predicted ArsR family transcriptional regulator
MSAVVTGAWMYKLLPDLTEPGITAADLADEMEVDPRTTQRHLVKLEREGLATCEARRGAQCLWRRV